MLSTFSPKDAINVMVNKESRQIKQIYDMAVEWEDFSLVVVIIFRRVILKTGTRVQDGSHLFDTKRNTELRFCLKIDQIETIKTAHHSIIEHMRVSMCQNRATIDIYNDQHVIGQILTPNILFELKQNTVYYDFFTDTVYNSFLKSEKPTRYNKIVI